MEMNKDYNTSISVGLTIVRKKTKYRKIFIEADKALYQAKAKGKGEVVLYHNPRLEAGNL